MNQSLLSMCRDLSKERNQKTVLNLSLKEVLTPKSSAFHGTSLEAIKILYETGYLPILTDGLYFFLNPELDVSKILLELKAEDIVYEPASASEAYLRAKNYARTVAGDTRLVKLYLGTEYTHESRDRMMQAEDLEKIPAALLSEAKLAKGFVVVFNRELIKLRVKLPSSSRGDDGFRVLHPKGIPLEMIAAIKPVGTQEIEFINQLNKERP